jgi:hypothetical protein
MSEKGSEMISNIWKEWKTSIIGVLVATVTVAGVLSQQGVTLGKAGTGTVIALVGAIATALLGLLSKDPAGSSSQGSTQRLGAWMLIALLLQLNVVALTGCNQKQRITVAQEIVDYGPAVTSAVDMAISTASLFVAFPGDKLEGFDTLSAGLQAAAKDYLANPNQASLAFLQSQIVKFQQAANSGLLQVAHIQDPASQKLALAAINGVAVVVNTVLGLVQSISSKQQVASMAAQVKVPLVQVRPLMDEAAMQRQAARVSQDLQLERTISVDQFFAVEAQAGF